MGHTGPLTVMKLIWCRPSVDVRPVRAGRASGLTASTTASQASCCPDSRRTPVIVAPPPVVAPAPARANGLLDSLCVLIKPRAVYGLPDSLCVLIKSTIREKLGRRLLAIGQVGRVQFATTT